MIELLFGGKALRCTLIALILLGTTCPSFSQIEYSFLTKYSARASALVVGENGHLYYSDYNTFKIKELDTSGTLVNEFGVIGSGLQEFEASDVTLNNDGDLLITDYHYQRIQVYKKDGSYIKTIAQPDGILAVDIALDNDNKMYIVETMRHRILILDKDGNFIGTFGSEGSGNGQFKYPQGIAITSDRIYVTDGSNNRIQVFDKSTNFLFSFGIGSGSEQVSNPRKVFILGSVVHVIDGANYLRFYDFDGNYLGKQGGGGSTDQTFSFPIDIFLTNDKVFIADYYNQFIKVFSINKLQQTIAFYPLPIKTYNDPPFTLDGTSSSNLPLTYSSSDETVASVIDNQVFIHDAGTITITARQAGNENFHEAYPVHQPLTINRAIQEINSFPAIAEKTYGDPIFELTASATSTLPIEYSLSNDTVVLLINDKVFIAGTGSVMIYANQPGNSMYFPAQTVSQQLTVNKKSQTIFFESIPLKKEGDEPFQISALSTSELDLTLTIDDSSIATISPTKIITILKPGQTVVRANQVGNKFYKPALEVTHPLHVDVVTEIGNESLNLTMFPNPCQDFTIIHIPNANTFSVQLFDPLGNLFAANVEKSSEELIVDLSNASTGLYFVRLKNESQMKVIRLIKIK